MQSFNVGIIGASGTIGKKYVELLSSHPWFRVTALASSEKNAGKTYEQAVYPYTPPPFLAKEILFDGNKDIEKIAKKVDFVFCAVGGKTEDTKDLEERYAKAEIPVLSNNAALREKEDVPVVIPELNPEHLSILPFQKKRLGTKRGFCAVKSNCSLQSFLPLLYPLRSFGLKEVVVTTMQAASGAGKTVAEFPFLQNNVIPFIPMEEEKSEREPLKILGKIENGKIRSAPLPKISAHCTRVPVENGHTAITSVNFFTKPTREEILSAWKNFTPKISALSLPSAPKKWITYFDEPDRPQPFFDSLTENGMGICAGRLKEDAVFDYSFVGLSHNTVRGAAGGAILLAELLAVKGYL